MTVPQENTPYLWKTHPSLLMNIPLSRSLEAIVGSVSRQYGHFSKNLLWKQGKHKHELVGSHPHNRNMGLLLSSCWSSRAERGEKDLEKESKSNSTGKNGLSQPGSNQREAASSSAGKAKKGSSSVLEESVYFQAEKNLQDQSNLNDSSMSFDSSQTTQPLLSSSSVQSKLVEEVQDAGKELDESSNSDIWSQKKDPSDKTLSLGKPAVISYPFNNQFLFSVNTVYPSVLLFCSLFSMMTDVLCSSSVRMKIRRR